MSRSVVLEFYPEGFHFSAGHFTLFSATARERWHGHNYAVGARLVAKMSEPGLTLDYGIFKAKLREFCDELDSYFILPGRSPYLKITDQPNEYIVQFDQDRMVFLKKDALILPIENTTLEDLSQWFIDRFQAEHNFLLTYGIQALTIKVFNSAVQSGSASWEANL